MATAAVVQLLCTSCVAMHAASSTKVFTEAMYTSSQHQHRQSKNIVDLLRQI